MTEGSAAAPAETLADVLTPALVLDLARLRCNAGRMRERARSLGVALRPHMKTAKSLEIGEILVGTGPRLATVSTLAEASAFLAHGFGDVLYAVGIAGAKLPEAARAAAAGAGRLSLILDSVEAADAVAAFVRAHGPLFDILIEVDCDGTRAGVAPTDNERLLAIAERLAPLGILRGVMTHAGGSYAGRSMADHAAAAEQERAAAVRAASVLRAAGHPAPVVSVGSTPTAVGARHLEGVTELRCGVYGFFDLFQAGIGTCDIADIAISVLASVICRSADRGRLLVDAGFLALSRDRATADLAEDWGFGRVGSLADAMPIDDLFVSGTNQEHGAIGTRLGKADPFRFRLGDRLRILPNHACATAAGHSHYVVVDSGPEVIARWPRIAGWAA